MCGIAGAINTKEGAHQLNQILAAQAHRGPDYTGTMQVAPQTYFGHNRLSILDLSEAAHQPMTSSSGRFTVVFNGEIYNYKEIQKALPPKHYKSGSDTEVLLHAYETLGEKCLEQFNGMFSFAIWDHQNQELFAARDRFGVKPFYYYHQGNQLLFASEVHALQAAGLSKNPNESVWASFLVHGSYGMPHQTFWENIQELPGGHVLKYKDGKVSVNKWFDFEAIIAAQPQFKSFEELKEAYLDLLKESVELRFRADVPVGFNLSGGLDSSTLLAMVDATAGKGNIEAFTFFTGDERYDELPWVEALLAQTHHPLNKVLLEAQAIPEFHKQLQSIQDAPYGGIPTIAYSRIFAAARAKGVIVLLDGQGMDEAWAGYDYYHKAGGGVVQGSTDAPVRPEVLNPKFAQLAEKPKYPQLFDDPVKNLQYRDLFYTKIPRALRFNDRVSMLHSTELREPFLDYRLVALAFAQPTHLKVRDGLTKVVLRDIVKDYLPASVSMAPKRPLQTPQREWLRGPLQPWVNQSVKNLANHPWFNSQQLQTTWNNYLQGQSDNSFYVWQWVSVFGE